MVILKFGLTLFFNQHGKSYGLSRTSTMEDILRFYFLGGYCESFVFYTSEKIQRITSLSTLVGSLLGFPHSCNIVIPFCVSYIDDQFFKESHMDHLFKVLVTWARYRARILLFVSDIICLDLSFNKTFFLLNNYLTW